MVSTMQLLVRGSILAGAVALSAGCATSPVAGYMSASQEDAETVKNGGYSDAAMAQIAIVQNPKINGGKLSPEAVRVIQELSMSCQQQVDGQLAGAAQSGIYGGVDYGITGLGVGPAARVGFGKMASIVKYAGYGAIASILPGAYNGLITGSYAMASAKGTCTDKFWTDVSKTRPEFAGTHVLTVFAGKKWGDSAPPALDKSAVMPASQGQAQPQPPVLAR